MPVLATSPTRLTGPGAHYCAPVIHEFHRLAPTFNRMKGRGFRGAMEVWPQGSPGLRLPGSGHTCDMPQDGTCTGATKDYGHVTRSG